MILVGAPSSVGLSAGFSDLFSAAEIGQIVRELLGCRLGLLVPEEHLHDGQALASLGEMDFWCAGHPRFGLCQGRLRNAGLSRYSVLSHLVLSHLAVITVGCRPSAVVWAIVGWLGDVLSFGLVCIGRMSGVRLCIYGPPSLSDLPVAHVYHGPVVAGFLGLGRVCAD